MWLIEVKSERNFSIRRLDDRSIMTLLNTVERRMMISWKLKKFTIWWWIILSYHEEHHNEEEQIQEEECRDEKDIQNEEVITKSIITKKRRIKRNWIITKKRRIKRKWIITKKNRFKGMSIVIKKSCRSSRRSGAGTNRVSGVEWRVLISDF